MNILIAEDDSISRMMLQAMLKKWGFEVESCADGNAAWEALQRPDAPSLVILDWQMPGQDGPTLCSRLRKLDNRIRYVMLLTAMSTKDDVVTGLEAGADDYVTKPFDANELRARLSVAERMIDLRKVLAARVEELEKAAEHIRTLQGILPICMHCHSIRNDDQAWQRIEKYIEAHSAVRFSHGLCPECLEKHYGKKENARTN